MVDAGARDAGAGGRSETGEINDAAAGHKDVDRARMARSDTRNLQDAIAQGLSQRPKDRNNCSVVVTISDGRGSIHQFNSRLISLSDRDLVLPANISEGVKVKCWSSDPAEPFTKGVVRIDDVPMTGGIRYGHRTF